MYATALRSANSYNRSLIEASIDPLVTIGRDGTITGVNAATENATGIQHKAETSALSTRALELPRGNETILLVEDDAIVRDTTMKALKRLGYTVLHASNGNEAIGLAGQHRGRIHLLLTDVVMPGMNGRQLAERLVSIYPGMQILYSSGYTENMIAHHGVIEEGLSFIGKPYTPQVLAMKIREVLSAAAKESVPD